MNLDMSIAPAPLLLLKGVHAHYGKSHILHGLDFHLEPNEVVSLLGRNGSGRSTTMKTIMGLVPVTGGEILLRDKRISDCRSFQICRAGVAYVPEEREVFANLTVDENLRMGEQRAVEGRVQWTVEQMYDYFPRLKDRRNTKGGSLSGGEQQMLTICRSLLGNPLLMLIDEPTEGLAPMIVQVVREVIQDIHRKGVSVVLVEQKLAIALKVSNRVCVMGHGRIVFEGTPHELASNPQLMKDWIAL